MTVGEMLRSFLTKLEWFSTLFPRIPVPVQKNIDQQMKARPRKVAVKETPEEEPAVAEEGRQVERRRSRYRSHNVLYRFDFLLSVPIEHLAWSQLHTGKDNTHDM